MWYVVKTLVDFSHVGLDRVWEDGEDFHLGAMVWAIEFYRSVMILVFVGYAIFESVFVIVSEFIRNLIFLGGNVVYIILWSDLLFAL